ncbi:MAG TPA: glycosyl transferase family 2 [Marinilabiliales bacterium]|nr:MAG: glycosyl transferase family 2 [Bacteroidetes bacterium GWA2_40_14]OFX72318.1 MAG: glycosyl transferase family 2 [Bacteroidetes bacterium GWD2_40_43]OFX90434.1 MAG: glycosyl transferase family 2 [Bacteroidetes bacterium GWE2_40_63]OFY17320.1 MAG: glycosyl transferase family 2 [Bacteroidetes bacterium GWF2_40_13]OFZ27336.1 MAG: glycosyl transferase family 2 [Bacteroidetes bacterium RIFOXYC2_FULL_40_12]HAN00890.1 glycosyl transferase family 2 [Marinilabiliales bacterium]
MISVNGLTVEFSGTPLFDEVSFLINPRDRVGLTGKNGAGKSTLLKILYGIQPFDKGQIAVPKDTTIGYLPQQMAVSDTQTVFNEAMNAFSEILTIESNIQRLNEALAERTDYESKEYLNLIHQLTEKSERFNLLGGASIQANIENTLIGLGFNRSDFERPTGEFSGGWRMRIELAKVLLRKPDVLLLDEPTNHLDIESVQWFEEMLKVYEGAVVVVSHDKAFLDNLTTRTLEISLGKIYDYKVSYSKYVQLRHELLEQQRAAYENQQKKIEETEEFIERFRYKATKSVQVQSRIKMLDKIDRIEIDELDASSIHFRFPSAPHSGQVVVETKELSKSFGNHLVLDKLDFTLEKGEKVAFVGKNGEGKTTFSRVIIGQHEFQGYLKLGHNVRIGYYAQNQSEMLDDNKTVLQTIDLVATGDVRLKIRDILASFLFRGEEVDKKVSVLSGGERARLSLAKLLLEPANLLVLDEPTNHLDMRSKDILKQALMNFDGTVILVSHDRDFLDGVVQTVYEFKNKKAKQHLGGIAEFLEKKKLETLNQLNIQKRVVADEKPKELSESKIKYEERKEVEKRIRKAQKTVEESEERIMKLETDLELMDQMLSRPENLSDPKVFEKYDSLKKELEKEMHLWEQAHQEWEELKRIKTY